MGPAWKVFSWDHDAVAQRINACPVILWWEPVRTCTWVSPKLFPRFSICAGPDAHCIHKYGNLLLHVRESFHLNPITSSSKLFKIVLYLSWYLIVDSFLCKFYFYTRFHRLYLCCWLYIVQFFSLSILGWMRPRLELHRLRRLKHVGQSHPHTAWPQSTLTAALSLGSVGSASGAIVNPLNHCFINFNNKLSVIGAAQLHSEPRLQNYCIPRN